jgi:hypothetical protein
MAKAPAHFDAETIALLKVALDEAWDCLPRKLQATMLKTTLAERILKTAAEGERNRERLREAALRDLAASDFDTPPHGYHGGHNLAARWIRSSKQMPKQTYCEP